LEVPLEAAAASAAASPVWVAADFDRACGVRRRGVRWRSRAGWFASPISDFSALFACLRGCLLAIVFILWIRIALRDACTTTSPALGARRVATQEGPSTWTAMLPVPGKSSGKCAQTTIFAAGQGPSNTTARSLTQSRRQLTRTEERGGEPALPASRIA